MSHDATVKTTSRRP